MEKIGTFKNSNLSKVLENIEPVMISDVRKEPDNDFSDTLKLMKIGSVMCVPLTCRSEVYGVLYVDTIDKTNGFRKEDLALLITLCSPLALVIENLLLRSEKISV